MAAYAISHIEEKQRMSAGMPASQGDYIVRAILALFVCVSATFAQNAKIQGVVKDDGGTPVAGAYIIATGQSASNHMSYTALAGAQGEYTLEALPPGKYSICVQTPGGPHLNPCEWTTGAQVTLAGSQTLGNHPLSVTKGSRLQLRIEDPKKLIAPADDILVGILLPSGMFHPLRLASADANGRTYDAAVPLNAPVRLSVISTHLQMSDYGGKSLTPAAVGSAAGQPIGQAATSSVVTMPSQTAVNGPPITFTVTGRK